jgi:hypothetical protein
MDTSVSSKYVLFACFCPEGTLNSSQLEYIKELTTLPYKIRVLSTHPRTRITEGQLPENVELFSDKNLGLDFGLWFRELQGPRARDYELASQIILCNDSCSIQYPLMHTYFRMKEHAFWGITSSIDIDLHLQSYFLCFSTFSSVEALLQFTRTCKTTENCTKAEIILRREIALSQFMLTKNFFIAAAFPYNLINPESNLSLNSAYFSWVNLKFLGCPLLKNNREKLPKLISARYGSSTRTVCVIDRVLDSWKAGMTLVVSPSSLFCDPCFNEPKFLVLNWESVDGEAIQKKYGLGDKAQPWKP